MLYIVSMIRQKLRNLQSANFERSRLLFFNVNQTTEKKISSKDIALLASMVCNPVPCSQSSLHHPFLPLDTPSFQVLLNLESYLNLE